VTIAESVRNIRKRLSKNQMQFAEMLGCQRNTVSRYELGQLVPGPRVLAQLLDLAVGHERKIIEAELRGQFKRGSLSSSSSALLGSNGSFELVLQLMRNGMDKIAGAVPPEKLADHGFRQFVAAVGEVVAACDTVDPSVTEMLLLWVRLGQTERAASHFRDALGYLRARLLST